MKFVFNGKFIFWNFIALMVIKTGFAYPAYQLTSLISGVPGFTKEEIVAETNEFRASVGVQPLKSNLVLDIAAAQKLQDMKLNQYFAHYSPSGVSPWHWFEVNKYGYSFAGENLAIGFLDAESTVRAWSNSPSHLKNLAGTNFQDIGVAVGEAKIKDVEGFVVVQLFGAPSVPKPSPAVVTQPKKSFSISISGAGAATNTPSPAPTKTAAPSTPVPTQVITPAPTQTIAQTPVPTGQVQGGTPTRAPAVLPIAAIDSFPEESPVATNVVRLDTGVNTFARLLNKGFVFYALLAALGSLVYLMMAGAKRELFLKTSLNFALFLLALFLPLIEVSRTALILGARAGIW